MNGKTLLRTAESNYALVRLSITLLALASVELGISAFSNSIFESPVTLGYAVFAFALLLTTTISPETSALRVKLSALADAAFIGSAVVLEGCIPLLTASPLLLMIAAWSMSRREQELAASYHVLALIIAWIASGWHLTPLLQVAAAVYITVTLAYALHLGRRLEREGQLLPEEVLIPAPLTTTVAYPADPDNASTPDPLPTADSQQQVHLLLGNTQDSHQLVKLLNGWGTSLHASSEVAKFIAEAYTDNEDDTASGTLIIDLRGRSDDPLNLLSLVRGCERLQQLRCILLSDDETFPGQSEGSEIEAFDAVLHSPLDKTLLFNALYSASSVQAPRGVTSLLDHYIREKTSLPPLEILLAISNQVQLKVAKRQLEKSGHNVYTTASGEQALDAMTEHRFDVAMLDIHLPDMDGIEVTRIYRLTHSRELSAPVMLLGRELDVETQRRCEHAGADSVLGLPLQAKQLNAALQLLFNQDGTPVPSELLNSTSTNTLKERVEELDTYTLRELEHLGNGLFFVQELIDSFIADSNMLIDAMHTAIDGQDLETFRDCAHALKGSAGSVGAARLQRFCIQLATINTNDFRNNTPVLMSGLVEATQTAHGALLNYINERAEQVSRS